MEAYLGQEIFAESGPEPGMEPEPGPKTEPELGSEPSAALDSNMPL
jgi:hypothetical protein